MATIAANITAISNAKSDLADNLTTKGVASADTEPLATLVGKVLDIPSGTTITGETTVTGVASENITAMDMVVRKYESDLTANFAEQTLATNIGARGYDVSFSSDSRFLAVTTVSSLVVYENTNGTWAIKFTDTSISGDYVDFSPNARFLCLLKYVSTTSILIYTYKIIDGVFTYLGATECYPTVSGTVKALVWNPSSTRLYFSGTNDVVGCLNFVDDDIALTVPNLQNTSADITSIAINSAGTKMAIICGSALIIYTIDGDNFTQVQSIAHSALGETAMVFTPNTDSIIFTSKSATPYVFQYDYVVDSYVANNFTTLTTNVGDVKLGLSRDGKYLFIPRPTSTVMSAYRLIDGVYTFFTTPKPANVTLSAGYSATFSDDGVWLAYAFYGTTPTKGVAIFKNNGSTRNIHKVNTIADVQGFTDIGYATSTVTSGNTATMKSLVRNPSNYPV